MEVGTVDVGPVEDGPVDVGPGAVARAVPGMLSSGLPIAVRRWTANVRADVVTSAWAVSGRPPSAGVPGPGVPPTIGTTSGGATGDSVGATSPAGSAAGVSSVPPRRARHCGRVGRGSLPRQLGDHTASRRGVGHRRRLRGRTRRTCSVDMALDRDGRRRRGGGARCSGLGRGRYRCRGANSRNHRRVITSQRPRAASTAGPASLPSVQIGRVSRPVSPGARRAPSNRSPSLEAPTCSAPRLLRPGSCQRRQLRCSCSNRRASPVGSPTADATHRSPAAARPTPLIHR